MLSSSHPTSLAALQAYPSELQTHRPDGKERASRRRSPRDAITRRPGPAGDPAAHRPALLPPCTFLDGGRPFEREGEEPWPEGARAKRGLPRPFPTFVGLGDLRHFVELEEKREARWKGAPSAFSQRRQLPLVGGVAREAPRAGGEEGRPVKR